jgi:hypothetical protein
MLNTLMTLKLDSDLVHMYIRLYLSKIKDDFMLDYNISKYSDIQNQMNYLKLVDAINITAKNGVDVNVSNHIALRKQMLDKILQRIKDFRIST